MAVSHFDAQGDDAVGTALCLQRRAQACAPVASDQAGAAAGRGIAAQGAHVLQQFFRRAVGQGQDLLVHDGVGEAVFHQQVAEVVHVDEGRRGGAQAGIIERLAQLAQRRRAQTGEHRQPADLEDTAPFAQHGVRFAVPVQGQVGPHQFVRFRRQAGGGQIGVDEAGGRAPTRQFADPGAESGGRVALAGNVQQRFAIVQTGVGGLGIALAQQGQVVARAAAGVEHGLRLHADVLQPAQHAAGDFAIQELGFRQVAAAGELAWHVGGDER